MATLSILGLYNYDPTIFDGLALPGLSDITSEAEKVSNPWIPDKDDFIAYLCMQLAELSLVYASAPIMSTMIAVWSAAHRNEWVQLYNTMLYKYNPIWNKDGSYTETRNLATSGKSSGKASGETKNDVTGYDSNAYSPNIRNTNDGSQSAESSGSETETITRTEAGNIGVTMTQEMIERQREIVKFNLYEYITQEFKNQFCVMVY